MKIELDVPAGWATSTRDDEKRVTYEFNHEYSEDLQTLADTNLTYEAWWGNGAVNLEITEYEPDDGFRAYEARRATYDADKNLLLLEDPRMIHWFLDLDKGELRVILSVLKQIHAAGEAEVAAVAPEDLIASPPAPVSLMDAALQPREPGGDPFMQIIPVGFNRERGQ
jgi:hypothetical protein